MTEPAGPARPRLDSWKAIADYLHREVATVRRWEKALGLPIRRLPGAHGHSVFAYRDEIDAWLEATPPGKMTAPDDTGRGRLGWLAVGIAITIAVVAVVAWRAAPSSPAAGDLRVDVTADAVVASDTSGTERWRFVFPLAHQTMPPPDAVRIVSGSNPAIYVNTGFHLRRSDGGAESGRVLSLDPSGRIQKTFSFTDQVSFAGKTYGPPWGMNAVAVTDLPDGRRRIAAVGHHYIWFPSLVTVMDERWDRRSTFVHAGWIESVYWLGEQQLLIGGFSQPHDGGMLALLEPGAPAGQGPEQPGTEYYCENCGPDGPIKMVIMKRSEVNRVSGAPFNRAVVQVTGDRIIARTIEIPAATHPVDAVYEFTGSLDLINATYSDRYWDAHRALEHEGKLDHSRDRCPDRDGPREVHVWDPSTGWARKELRSGRVTGRSGRSGR